MRIFLDRPFRSEGWLVSEHLFVLEVAHIRELVDSLGISFFDGVVVEDIFVGLGEEAKSVGIFLFSSIGSMVLGDEIDEGSFSVTDWGGEER